MKSKRKKGRKRTPMVGDYQFQFVDEDVSMKINFVNQGVPKEMLDNYFHSLAYGIKGDVALLEANPLFIDPLSDLNRQNLQKKKKLAGG